VSALDRSRSRSSMASRHSASRRDGPKFDDEEEEETTDHDPALRPAGTNHDRPLRSWSLPGDQEDAAHTAETEEAIIFRFEILLSVALWLSIILIAALAARGFTYLFF